MFLSARFDDIFELNEVILFGDAKHIDMAVDDIVQTRKFRKRKFFKSAHCVLLLCYEGLNFSYKNFLIGLNRVEGIKLFFEHIPNLIVCWIFRLCYAIQPLFKLSQRNDLFGYFL